MLGGLVLTLEMFMENWRILRDLDFSQATQLIPEWTECLMFYFFFFCRRRYIGILIEFRGLKAYHTSRILMESHMNFSVFSVLNLILHKADMNWVWNCLYMLSIKPVFLPTKSCWSGLDILQQNCMNMELRDWIHNVFATSGIFKCQEVNRIPNKMHWLPEPIPN